MKRTVSTLLLIVSTLAALALPPRRHKSNHKVPEFDYYVLSLSWAPSFCASHPADRSSECSIGSHTAFVLHGLWPQSPQNGPPPMECAPARPVSKSTVDSMMRFYPSRGLVQHEWEKHGTCSNLSSADYFHQVEQAFTSVKVPPQFSALDRDQQFDVKQIEESFASANNAPKDSFRISCHAGEMVGVDICRAKDLKYQVCSASVRECPTDRVLLRAPR
jgi:ribonuclease T2